MGLIRLAAAVLGAGAASLNTTLGNSWIDYFESGDMSGGVIQRRAQRIVGPRSKNKNSDENIISSGSIIDVQENQCMILVENGRIVGKGNHRELLSACQTYREIAASQLMEEELPR